MDSNISNRLSLHQRYFTIDYQGKHVDYRAWRVQRNAGTSDCNSYQRTLRVIC